ncbi:dehydrogenase [Aeromicrobium sp. PE09-221]|uniref:Gfo/Idh/MocA family protein n=1 Tax=Aeromicrobium sp. PE09-221 TaxID=1898043 RepID=UPI000B3EE255|nr:Gfo/Idh/MocA family oxidoreductase [Aeromicrobium sp. PE09-221]OUZ07579.1 dehydrogenase [Aeromicrobium sp. PE09-221]
MNSARPELGIAVIGYSFMGKAHSNGWRNVGAFYPGGPTVAQRVIVGRDRERVDAAARQYGWQESATDWRAVLDRADVDVVDICTPGHLHEEIALAALDAGKHVLLEKPLANTLDEARKLAASAAAARDRGVSSMVAFNYRRIPALALARRLTAEGVVGEVREVRAAYLQDWLADERAPMAWRLRQEQAGSGVLGDLGSHVVDLLRFTLGQEVATVSGQLRTFVDSREGERGPEEVTVDDVAWARLGLSGGAIASLEVSRMAFGRKNGLTLEIYGSRGALSFGLERLNELWVDEGDGARRVLVTEPDHPYLDAWWPPGHVLGWDSTFTTQAAEFVHAIAEGREPSPSFEDGLRVQHVLDAIVRSSDLQQTVTLEGEPT